MSEFLERVLLDLREEIKRYSVLATVTLKELRELLAKRTTETTSLTEQLKQLETELKKPHTWHEDKLLTNYELRDAEWHYTAIANTADYDIIAWHIANELDQPITCQIKGNRLESTLTAANMGEPFTVAAGEYEIRTLNVYMGKWAPYAFLAFKAEAAPSRGMLHVTCLKRVG